MSLSSFPVSLSTDTSTPRSRDDLRASTVEAIVAVIDIPALFGDGSSPVNVSEVERGLKGLMNDSCRAAMGEYIERLDDGRPTLLRDGEIWTRVPKTRNSIMTLFGKVTYERHRHRRAGSPSLVPVDERLHEHHGLLCCTPPRPPSRFESDATGIGSTVRLSRFSIAAKGGRSRPGSRGSDARRQLLLDSVEVDEPWCAGRGCAKEADRKLALIALMEWEDRRDRWLSIPALDRDRFVRELARLMVRMEETADDGQPGEDHAASS